MISAFFVFCSDHALAKDPVFLGILESFNKQEWSGQTQNSSINPRVRIPFFKKGDCWEAMKNDFETPEQLRRSIIHYPSEITWLVINNEHYLGNIFTVRYTPHWYADIGIHRIIRNLPKKFQLPPIRNLNFPMAKMDHKPLVLISKFNNFSNHFNDDEDWKIAKPTKDEIKQAIQGYHKITRLRNNNLLSNYSDENYKAQVIECYRSYKDHGVILSILIKNVSKPENHYIAEIPHWFYIPIKSKEVSAQFLGTGLSLIEKADIDNDGRTEWIFFYSDPYNEDQNINGYILFYNDFKQSTRFVWNNH